MFLLTLDVCVVQLSEKCYHMHLFFVVFTFLIHLQGHYNTWLL